MHLVKCVLFSLVCAAFTHKFPDDFKFGVATSSYQVEGGWNANGKSESIWDYHTHNFPEKIAERSNGDIACDSYNKHQEDVDNMHRLKVDFYRFSISWPRVLPGGFANRVNRDGIDYYNRLIDSLHARNIEPMVTLFHWDLPQSLQNLGGWNNHLMAEYFADFAEVCFRHFGDRVRFWITINDPATACILGYGNNSLAPYYENDGVGNYMCAHNMILGHAKAYRLYQKRFKNDQKGQVGMTVDATWYEPLTNSTRDREAAELIRQTYLGIYLHPFLSNSGDYPRNTRDRIDKISRLQGFTSSRLPRFTKYQVEYMKGAMDFIGYNYYSTYYVKYDYTFSTITSFMNDMGVAFSQDPLWADSARDFFKVVPWGFRRGLNWVHRQYPDVPIIITENGYAGFHDEGLDDEHRIRFTNSHLKEILAAIYEDGINLLGYTFWSLMDNFEWMDGYTIRFGLYSVNFKDPNRKRTPKKSAYIYQHIIVNRTIDEDLRLNDFKY